MNQQDIMAILDRFAKGELTREQAAEQLDGAAFDDLGYAKIDLGRKARTGYSEVIYTAGKTVEQFVGIVQKMIEAGEENILCTRCEPAYAEALGDVPLAYHHQARIAVVKPRALPLTEGYVAVCCAGTSDIPVAEEAAVTLETFGNRVLRCYDAGVAGLSRLMSRIGEIRGASAVIAVAGMEGALGSVLAGLVDCPVIGVPTSVGYGTALGGITALFAMLNSCSSGLTVVNIDNGFGAGFYASMINRRTEK